MTSARCNVVTAGWAMPALDRAAMAPDERPPSALERYAAELPAVGVNSCFHRHHRPATWARWRDATPSDFRFAVKLAKAITHGARLELEASLPVLEQFIEEVSQLGPKLGPLLVQLPPSLEFDAAVAEAFWTMLRERWAGHVVCEPRHASWFEADADALLVAHRVARVGADPARVPAAAEPGGWPGLVYLRLHGSPRTYYSSYEPDVLDRVTARLAAAAADPAVEEAWCCFDNTASGAAIGNALTVRDALPR
ncbi:MAG: hypothetical protein JWM98_522 [Thermoleophilia bacterium]|nr:hypothetical protein [Thermoleophilia bacterium]